MAGPHRIDVHHHAVPPEWRSALERIGADRSGGSPLPDWDAPSALRAMDRHGIGAAVLSVSSPGVWFADRLDAADLARRCNDALARLAADHPRRFGALAILPLPDVEASLREVERALDGLRLDGVILLANAGGRYLGDPAFDPVLEELDRRGATALVHPTDPPGLDALGFGLPSFLLEFPFDTTRAAANLIASGAAERFRKLRLVLSHAGGAAPFLAWRMAQVGASLPAMRERAPRGPEAYLRGFHYDTALAAGPAALAALAGLVGPEKVLFGTDHPYVPEPGLGATAEGVDGFAGWDEAARGAVLRGNALRLFPRLAKRLGAG